jgi:ATP-dependent Clp protease ATP-binding subunit ClpC
MDPERTGEAMTWMMTEGLTDEARKAVDLAREESRSQNCRYIDSGHLLLGLLAEGEGRAGRTLGSLGVTLAAARQELRNLVGVGYDAPTAEIAFTPRASHVLERAEQESRALGHQQVGTEHILSGLLREDDGLALVTLAGIGVDLDQVRRQVAQLPEAPDPLG